MPKYTVITQKTIEFEYDLEFNLPLDMGQNTNRLVDRMVRDNADAGTLAETVSMEVAVKEDDNGLEKIIAINRDGEQIWPRLRKKHTPKIAPNEIPGLMDGTAAQDPVSPKDWIKNSTKEMALPDPDVPSKS